MLTAEETKVITLDNEKLLVEDLPETAQQLVKYYDDWKQKEVEARSHLLLVQSGMRALGNEIAAAVQKDREEKAAAESEAAAAANEGDVAAPEGE